MASERWDVRFVGHVQGVGFRYSTMGIARGFEVSGTVENLPDGSVGMSVEGQAEELRSFLGEIQRAFDCHIRETLVDRLPASGAFTGFTIRQ
jgi:acylphosphatase